jgi:hypothetical protein
VRDNVAYEAALGDHGRSGEQFDIWQVVYSPTGEDGYPQPIFDKRTGVIDHNTAQYWREHYDLDAILQRDWMTLGPKLHGKLHLYVGSEDTYFLNDAVYLMEDFLTQTGTPGHGVPTREKCAMVRALSTAGTGIRIGQIGTLAFTTIRCTCPRLWSAFGIRLLLEPT